MADSMDTEYEITVAQKLCDWGLDDLVQTFEDNAVDGETFLALDDATLKELIPKLGQRMKFKNAVAKFKKEMGMDGSGDGNGQETQSGTESGTKRSGSTDGSGNVQSKKPRGDGPKRSFRILIFNNNVGKIIGKKGATINKLRNDHKAQVAISDGTDEAVLTITAQKDDAINCLMETVPNWHEFKVKREAEGEDFEAEVTMLVHHSHAGTVIGRGGSSIKELKKKHNCSINITKENHPNSTDQSCTVIGRLSKIADVLRDIDDIIEKVPIRGEERYYNPSTAYQQMDFQQGYDEGYGGGYGQGGGGYGGGSGGYGGYGSGGGGGGSGGYGGYGSGGSGGYGGGGYGSGGGGGSYGGGYGGGSGGGYSVGSYGGGGGGRMGGMGSPPGRGGGMRGGGMRGGGRGGRGQKRGGGGQY